MIGFDALPFALQAIRDGVMAATVDQKPGAQIRTALRMMNEHLRSQAPLRSIKIEPVLIEKSNLQDAEDHTIAVAPGKWIMGGSEQVSHVEIIQAPPSRFSGRGIG